jgi:iron complex transport system ATP-binding protein
MFKDPNESSLIEARRVSFAYADGAPLVVREASLRVERAQLVALIGANGSGKSSLVRLLAGLLTPLSGEIFFDGAPLKKIEPRRRARRIGYVPQMTRTVFPFTALEIVLTGRSPFLARFQFEKTRDVEIAQAALAAVDAAHLAARPVTELSGGERQLVALARALAQEPDLLLLDEPSSALDLKHRAQLIRHLRRLRDARRITSLVVTHDLQLLDPAFDLVAAMRCGEIIALGRPVEVLRADVLAEIYNDAHIRARRDEGRTFVWSEIAED